MASGIACFDLVLSVPDFLNLGSLMLLRSYSHLGCSMFMFGFACIGFSSSAANHTEPGSTFSLQSFTCLEAPAPMSDLLLLGFLLPFQSWAQLGFAFFIFGMA